MRQGLANAFDDPRRSIAVQQLLTLRYLKLLTEEEFSRFHAETRDKIDSFCRNDRASLNRRTEVNPCVMRPCLEFWRRSSGPWLPARRSQSESTISRKTYGRA